jgi:hypothetical protein
MTDNDPKDQPRSRLEDQVLEILQSSNKRPPARAKARSTWWSVQRSFRQARQKIVHFDNIWGWFGLAMVIFLLGGALTGDGLGERLVQYAGLAALVVGLVRMFRPSKTTSGKKMWRGNVIDMNKRGIELGDKWDDWKKRR